MTIQDEKLSAYAPIRYRKEPWWFLATSYAKNGLIAANGKIDVNLPQIIYKEVVTPILAKASKGIDGDTAPEWYGHLIAVTAELRHWVPLAGQYDLCGRQIFDLHDELVEMLEHTDFGDATLQDWHPPYDAFYIRFGKRNDISLLWDSSDSSNEYLDGAFIGITPWEDDPLSERFRLRIGFTTVKANGEGVMTPGYFIDLTPEEQLMPVIDAIDHALTRRISALYEYSANEQIQIINSYRIEQINESAELLRKSSMLLINAMFYLETIGKDHKKKPGRDSPPSLDIEWANTLPEKKHKLKSRLTKDGYALVYLLGAEISGNSRSTGSGTKAAHWRRGHWRNQPHGTGKSFMKRIWIKPVLVCGSGIVADIPGHLYISGSAIDTSKH